MPMRESRRLLWPLAALAALLIFNALFDRPFFHLEVRDGRVYGSMIDVLNRGAPVMLLSLGMSLVIATGGIDLSVGPVMAIAGAVEGDDLPVGEELSDAAAGVHKDERGDDGLQAQSDDQGAVP